MVCVVDFGDEIGGGQLDLMYLQLVGFVVGCEFELCVEKQQDVCGLFDDYVVCFQEWWCEWYVFGLCVVYYVYYGCYVYFVF